MGIPGLTTFIDSNLHLLDKFELHDTKLIIDGNNLYHLLFYDHRIDFVHGGDYDKFAAHTHNFFNILKECNITPYVIFDGGYDIDEKKLKTAVERARERCHLAGFISHGGKGKVMPILAYEVFRRTLLELGVPHCVCDFEADDQIAVLANEFRAPVLSYDSDFYVFDLVAGYIPFDGVNFVVCKSEDKQYSFLPCCIYYAENFTKHFPDLGKSVLPLMATLLGNDFVPHWIFDDFYQQLKTPKKGNSKFDIPISRTKMRSLFHWLESVTSLEKGIERVLSCFKEEKLEMVESVMKLSLKAYSNVLEYSRVNLRLLLEGSVKDMEEQCLKSQSSLPTWFRCAFWRGDIDQLCQNVVMLHRVILSCQVEDMNAPSTTDCCRNVRQVLYGVLTFGQPIRIDTTMDSIDSLETNSSSFITEYSRHMKNIKRWKVQPALELPGYGKLPVLDEISTMGNTEKFSLILSALGLSNSKILQFPEELQLTMATVIYWIKESDPAITQNEVTALITCIIAMETRRIQRQRVTTDVESENVLEKIIQKSTNGQVEKFLQNVRKYFEKVEHNKKHPVDVRIIHNFSQFQACFKNIMILNQILQQPLSSPNPATFFNGSFLYSFTKNLNCRPNIHLYISEIFVKHSALLEFYSHLFQVVSEEVGDLCLKCDCTKVGKKQKKARKRTSSANHESTSHVDEVESSDQIITGMEFEAACDVSNRFHAFNLVDS